MGFFTVLLERSVKLTQTLTGFLVFCLDSLYVAINSTQTKDVTLSVCCEEGKKPTTDLFFHSRIT